MEIERTCRIHFEKEIEHLQNTVVALRGEMEHLAEKAKKGGEISRKSMIKARPRRMAKLLLL
jgi:hypothetical protein